MSALTQYDTWLAEDGPAALVLREQLVPVSGPDGVIFPASFAPAEGTDREKPKFQGGYNIDTAPDNTNICIIDTVGSQANRIEPLFAQERYQGLVPQVVITAGTKTINLLEAGHRAGDAAIRSTALQTEIHKAFRAVRGGDAEPLAKIAPTSLVFGVWDSRNTQAKLPRLIASTIRAYNVRPLTRAAQYIPAAEYEKEELLPPPNELKLTNKSYGERGFGHVPSSGTHGGVIADGGIRREAVFSLGALRTYCTAGTDKAKTKALQRYILGLSLVALTAPIPSYLRQGCDLVPDVDKPRELVLVHGDGRREAVTLTHDNALAFARKAASEFGIGEDRAVNFDKDLAKKDVLGEGDTEKSKKAKAKKTTEKS